MGLARFWARYVLEMKPDLVWHLQWKNSITSNAQSLLNLIPVIQFVTYVSLTVRTKKICKNRWSGVDKACTSHWILENILHVSLRISIELIEQLFLTTETTEMTINHQSMTPTQGFSVVNTFPTEVNKSGKLENCVIILVLIIMLLTITPHNVL